MAKRVTVLDLAVEAGIDLDIALIELWDAGFGNLRGPRDTLQRGEANRARRALGLATRRELATPQYWQDEFKISRPALDRLLADLGVVRPYDGSRLLSKAIRRLRVELRKRTPQLPPPTRVASSSVAPADPPLVWSVVGHVVPLSHLSAADIVTIHEALVTDFAATPDPLEPPGVRDRSLLESAVTRPRTSSGDALKYPTVEMAAAALLHSLVHNHPFHNGNKRTALVAMLVFLDDNGMMITCDEDDLFKMVLLLAQHAIVRRTLRDLPDREVLAVSDWLRQHTRWMEKGDRSIPWRKLKQVLARYDCQFSFPSVGNRINIERRVPGRRGWFGRMNDTVLRVQTHFGGEGREADKTAINRIRRELSLDDENGVDSAAFYEDATATASDFIVRYRKTLSRLARL